MTDFLDDRSARLELAVPKSFRIDPALERVCELWDTDRAAFNALPAALKAQHDIYRDFRESHRRAVEAGVLPDNTAA